MNNTLEHKGYIGSIEFSAEDKCLFGKIEFINDLILFDGESVEQIERAFQDAVNSYIDFCTSQGKEPNQPFKGSFNVRVGETLHRLAALEAKKTGVTLNDYIKQALEEKLNQISSTRHLSTLQSPPPRRLKKPSKHTNNEKHGISPKRESKVPHKKAAQHTAPK